MNVEKRYDGELIIVSFHSPDFDDIQPGPGLVSGLKITEKILSKYREKFPSFKCQLHLTAEMEVGFLFSIGRIQIDIAIEY